MTGLQYSADAHVKLYLLLLFATGAILDPRTAIHTKLVKAQ